MAKFSHRSINQSFNAANQTITFCKFAENSEDQSLDVLDNEAHMARTWFIAEVNHVFPW